MVAIYAITGVPLLTNLLALYQMGVSIRNLPIPIYNDRLYIFARQSFFRAMVEGAIKG